MIRVKVVAMRREGSGFLANFRWGFFGLGFGVAVGRGMMWRTRAGEVLPFKARRALCDHSEKLES